MRNFLTESILFLMLFTSVASVAQTVSSPNKRLKATFTIRDGKPFYNLEFKGETVILDSRLGIKSKQINLSDGFTEVSHSYDKSDTTWRPVWGEFSEIRNMYNEMTVELNQSASNVKMFIVFRMFNDALAFRYIIPDQDGVQYMHVTDEITEFHLTANHTVFTQPGDYQSNEYSYTTSKISNLKKELKKQSIANKTPEELAPGFVVQTPMMIVTDNKVYMNIHEAALVNYAGMLLNVDDKNYNFSAHLTPDKNGIKGYLQTPISTPWRTVLVSDKSTDILASQTILNLNEPSSYTDTSWIKPVKYMGVWWEYFIGKPYTWAYNSDYRNAKPDVTDYTKIPASPKHGANTAHVKEYLKFAADNGFDAVLVEGWNEGWEDWGAYNKEHIFSFTKAYPDFDVKELHRYADSLGIKVMMHHETASSVIDYERQMNDAFQFMADNGYNAVKTGYVGNIIPRSEYHSGQFMSNHFIRVANRAKDYKIMVNSHEAVRPTGLCRTYPNWLAQESARGTEFEAMGGNPPDHTTILPFTRLIGGPMDYTPGILQTDLDIYRAEGDKRHDRVHTTLVKQLALYLTMYSPLQMAADLPENYIRFADAFQFIKDVAVDWDYSWYLEAEPGDYITVARKTKGKDEWFIGGITDEMPREATIKLDFLPKGKYMATIYEDTQATDWEKNPMSYNIRKTEVANTTVLLQYMAPGGGVAIKLEPIK